MNNLIQLLPQVLEARENSATHARSDCHFALDPSQHQHKAITYYGIAHVLRHAARMAGLDPARVKGRSQEPVSYVRLAGWADDFYWLTWWSLTGKLRHDLDPENLQEDWMLLLIALLDTEWAGLLNEANFCLTQDSNSGNWDTEAFRIWTSLPTDPHARGEKLFARTHSRLRLAQAAAGVLRMRLPPSQPNRGAIDDQLRRFHRHASIEYARSYTIRLQWLPDQDQAGTIRYALKHVEDAQGTMLSDGNLDTVTLLRAMHTEICKGRAGNLYAGAFDLESMPAFQPIHLLAQWIVDLLTQNDRAARHPRSCYPQECLPQHADASEFPNVEAINYIEERLSEHKSWLRFELDAPDIKTIFDSIGSRKADFIRRAFLPTTLPNFDCKHRHSGRGEPPTADPVPVERDVPNGWELYVLRDWASFTPLLPGKDALSQRGRGGGYFLRTPTAGVAIDPGFDFIENLYEAGLHIRMITDIVVTHDHYDHVASFGPLLTLLHEYFKANKEAQPPLRGVNFFVSRNVLDHHARAIVDLEEFGTVAPLTAGDTKRGRLHRLADGCIEVLATHTEHGSPNGFGRGVGLKFIFPSANLPSLGITSDTGFYPVSSDSRKGTNGLTLTEEFRKGDGRIPAVMVLHVGSLKRDELIDSGFYRYHLGARGVFRSLEEFRKEEDKVQLALLGEFGEECRGYRGWFAQRINSYFSMTQGESESRKGFNCLPTDRNTIVSADTAGIWIERRGDLESKAPFAKVKLDCSDEPVSGEFHFKLRMP